MWHWIEERRASLSRVYKYLVHGRKPRAHKAARSTPPPAVVAAASGARRRHAGGCEGEDAAKNAECVESPARPKDAEFASVVWRPSSCVLVTHVALVTLLVVALSLAQNASWGSLVAAFLSPQDLSELGHDASMRLAVLEDGVHGECASFGTADDVYFERFGGLWCARALFRRPPDSLDDAGDTVGLVEIEDLRKVFVNKSEAVEYYRRFWALLIRSVVRVSALEETGRGYACAGRDCRVYTWVERVDTFRPTYDSSVGVGGESGAAGAGGLKRHVVYLFRTGRAIVRLRIAGDATRFQSHDAAALVRRVHAAASRSLRPERTEWKRQSALRDEGVVKTSGSLLADLGAYAVCMAEAVLPRELLWTGSAMRTVRVSENAVDFGPLDAKRPQPTHSTSAPATSASAVQEQLPIQAPRSTETEAPSKATPVTAPSSLKSQAVLNRVDNLITSLRAGGGSNVNSLKDVVSALQQLRTVLSTAQRHEVLLRARHEELRFLLGFAEADRLVESLRHTITGSSAPATTTPEPLSSVVGQSMDATADRDRKAVTHVAERTAVPICEGKALLAGEGTTPLVLAPNSSTAFSLPVRSTRARAPLGRTAYAFWGALCTLLAAVVLAGRHVRRLSRVEVAHVAAPCEESTRADPTESVPQPPPPQTQAVASKKPVAQARAKKARKSQSKKVPRAVVVGGDACERPIAESCGPGPRPDEERAGPSPLPESMDAPASLAAESPAAVASVPSVVVVSASEPAESSPPPSSRSSIDSSSKWDGDESATCSCDGDDTSRSSGIADCDSLSPEFGHRCDDSRGASDDLHALASLQLPAPIVPHLQEGGERASAERAAGHSSGANTVTRVTSLVVSDDSGFGELSGHDRSMSDTLSNARRCRTHSGDAVPAPTAVQSAAQTKSKKASLRASGAPAPAERSASLSPRERSVSGGSSDDGSPPSTTTTQPNRRARRASLSLPVYCFNCGLCGHVGSECPEPSMDEMLKAQQYQFVAYDMGMFDPNAAAFAQPQTF